MASHANNRNGGMLVTRNERSMPKWVSEQSGRVGPRPPPPPLTPENEDTVLKQPSLPSKTKTLPEPDYEVIEFSNQQYSNTPLRPHSSNSNSKTPDNKLKCTLCGSSNPWVTCDECAQQIFCASCDDMFHKHPKRKNHQRKTIEKSRPPLPPKISSGHPGPSPPVAPPRRNKRGLMTPLTQRKDQGNSMPGLLPVSPSPTSSMKSELWQERFGSLPRGLNLINRPLPDTPKTPSESSRSTTPKSVFDNIQRPPSVVLEKIKSKANATLDRMQLLQQRYRQQKEQMERERSSSVIDQKLLAFDQWSSISQSPSHFRSGSISSGINSSHLDLMDDNNFNLFHQRQLAMQHHQMAPQRAKQLGQRGMSTSVFNLNQLNRKQPVTNNGWINNPIQQAQSMAQFNCVNCAHQQSPWNDEVNQNHLHMAHDLWSNQLASQQHLNRSNMSLNVLPGYMMHPQINGMYPPPTFMNQRGLMHQMYPQSYVGQMPVMNPGLMGIPPSTSKTASRIGSRIASPAMSRKSVTLRRKQRSIYMDDEATDDEDSDEDDRRSIASNRSGISRSRHRRLSSASQIQLDDDIDSPHAKLNRNRARNQRRDSVAKSINNDWAPGRRASNGNNNRSADSGFNSPLKPSRIYSDLDSEGSGTKALVQAKIEQKLKEGSLKEKQTKDKRQSQSSTIPQKTSTAVQTSTMTQTVQKEKSEKTVLNEPVKQQKQRPESESEENEIEVKKNRENVQSNVSEEEQESEYDEDEDAEEPTPKLQSIKSKEEMDDCKVIVEVTGIKEDDLGPPPSTPDHEWECEFCTFVNEANIKICCICCKTPSIKPKIAAKAISPSEKINSSLSEKIAKKVEKDKQKDMDEVVDENGTTKRYPNISSISEPSSSHDIIDNTESTHSTKNTHTMKTNSAQNTDDGNNSSSNTLKKKASVEDIWVTLDENIQTTAHEVARSAESKNPSKISSACGSSSKSVNVERHANDLSKSEAREIGTSPPPQSTSTQTYDTLNIRKLEAREDTILKTQPPQTMFSDVIQQTNFLPSLKRQNLQSFEAEVFNKIHNNSHVPLHHHQQLHDNHVNQSIYSFHDPQQYRSNNDLRIDDGVSTNFESVFNGMSRRQPSINELMLLQKTSSQLHSPLDGSIYDLPYRELSFLKLNDMDNHKESDLYKYTKEELNAALKYCGPDMHPLIWLRDNWPKLIQTVQSLATKYGQERAENTIGTISQIEAKEALCMHSGNIWQAVSECIEQRQRKYREISCKGNFSREDIVTALTTHHGNIELALHDLGRSQLKPFLMRIWGSPGGVENESGSQTLDATITQSSQSTHFNFDKDIHNFLSANASECMQTPNESDAFHNNNQIPSPFDRPVSFNSPFEDDNTVHTLDNTFSYGADSKDSATSPLSIEESALNNKNVLKDLEILIDNMEHNQQKQNEPVLRSIQNMITNMNLKTENEYDSETLRILTKSPIISNKSKGSSKDNNLEKEADVKNFVWQHIQEIVPNLVQQVEMELMEDNEENLNINENVEEDCEVISEPSKSVIIPQPLPPPPPIDHDEFLMEEVIKPNTKNACIREEVPPEYKYAAEIATFQMTFDKGLEREHEENFEFDSLEGVKRKVYKIFKGPSQIEEPVQSVVIEANSEEVQEQISNLNKSSILNTLIDVSNQDQVQEGYFSESQTTVTEPKNNFSEIQSNAFNRADFLPKLSNTSFEQTSSPEIQSDIKTNGIPIHSDSEHLKENEIEAATSGTDLKITSHETLESPEIQAEDDIKNLLRSIPDNEILITSDYLNDLPSKIAFKKANTNEDNSLTLEIEPTFTDVQLIPESVNEIPSSTKTTNINIEEPSPKSPKDYSSEIIKTKYENSDTISQNPKPIQDSNNPNKPINNYMQTAVKDLSKELVIAESETVITSARSAIEQHSSISLFVKDTPQVQSSSNEITNVSTSLLDSKARDNSILDTLEVSTTLSGSTAEEEPLSVTSIINNNLQTQLFSNEINQLSNGPTSKVLFDTINETKSVALNVTINNATSLNKPTTGNESISRHPNDTNQKTKTSRIENATYSAKKRVSKIPIRRTINNKNLISNFIIQPKSEMLSEIILPEVRVFETSVNQIETPQTSIKSNNLEHIPTDDEFEEELYSITSHSSTTEMVSREDQLQSPASTNEVILMIQQDESENTSTIAPSTSSSTLHSIISEPSDLKSSTDFIPSGNPSKQNLSELVEDTQRLIKQMRDEIKIDDYESSTSESEYTDEYSDEYDDEEEEEEEIDEWEGEEEEEESEDHDDDDYNSIIKGIIEETEGFSNENVSIGESKSFSPHQNSQDHQKAYSNSILSNIIESFDHSQALLSDHIKQDESIIIETNNTQNKIISIEKAQTFVETENNSPELPMNTAIDNILKKAESSTEFIESVLLPVENTQDHENIQQDLEGKTVLVSRLKNILSSSLPIDYDLETENSSPELSVEIVLTESTPTIVENLQKSTIADKAPFSSKVNSSVLETNPNSESDEETRHLIDEFATTTHTTSSMSNKILDNSISSQQTESLEIDIAIAGNTAKETKEVSSTNQHDNEEPAEPTSIIVENSQKSTIADKVPFSNKVTSLFLKTNPNSESDEKTTHLIDIWSTNQQSNEKLAEPTSIIVENSQKSTTANKVPFSNKVTSLFLEINPNSESDEKTTHLTDEFAIATHTTSSISHKILDNSITSKQTESLEVDIAIAENTVKETEEVSSINQQSNEEPAEPTSIIIENLQKSTIADEVPFSNKVTSLFLETNPNSESDDETRLLIDEFATTTNTTSSVSHKMLEDHITSQQTESLEVDIAIAENTVKETKDIWSTNQQSNEELAEPTSIIVENSQKSTTANKVPFSNKVTSLFLEINPNSESDEKTTHLIDEFAIATHTISSISHKILDNSITSQQTEFVKANVAIAENTVKETREISNTNQQSNGELPSTSKEASKKDSIIDGMGQQYPTTSINNETKEESKPIGKDIQPSTSKDLKSFNTKKKFNENTNSFMKKPLAASKIPKPKEMQKVQKSKQITTPKLQNELKENLYTRSKSFSGPTTPIGIVSVKTISKKFINSPSQNTTEKNKPTITRKSSIAEAINKFTKPNNDSNKPSTSLIFKSRIQPRIPKKKYHETCFSDDDYETTTSEEEQEALDIRQRKFSVPVFRAYPNVQQEPEEINMGELVEKFVKEELTSTIAQAQIAAALVSMKFQQDVSLWAAKECSDLDHAIALLRQECELCSGTYALNQIVSMLKCTHKCCKQCAKTYFTVQITERSINDCNCPFCKLPELQNQTEHEDENLEYFSNLDIFLKSILEPEVHELFQRKLRDRTLLKDPNFKWCVQCSSGFFARPKQKRLICPDCGSVTCSQCRKPWQKQHEGISCDQFSEWELANDPEVQAKGVQQHLEQNGIDCPKCKFRYSLARGGCMHFTCTQCKYEFCYGCAKPFMMGAKCTISSYCAKLGLHAHHPRNCLFYLRDKLPVQLQILLKNNAVAYEEEPIDLRNDNKDVEQSFSKKQKLLCPIPIQKETPTGLVDTRCNGDVPEKHAGMCRTHYVEYLTAKVAKAKIDPLPIFDLTDCIQELRRRGIPLPDRGPWDTDEIYKNMCAEVIQKNIPLDAA